MGKSSSRAPAPDPQIGAAALREAQLGEEWLKFAKQQFAQGNIRQEEMDDLTREVIEQQLSTQDQGNQWAREDRQRTKQVFQPLEDEFIQEAKDYASPEKQAQAAAEATADVRKAASTQDQILTRNMASMGINPASGRFAATQRAAATDVALASAGAANNARQIVRDKGMALKADAVNIGRNLPSSTAAAYGIGLNAGNSAVGNQGAANANWFQNNSVMERGIGGAMQGYNNQAGILNNLYGNQVQAWSAQQQANATSSAGLGSMLGTGIGAFAAL